MDNKTENKLRDIMYLSMGYTNKHGGWRKREIKELGQIICSKCREYFDKEFIITRNNKKYCIECEKTVS